MLYIYLHYKPELIHWGPTLHLQQLTARKADAGSVQQCASGPLALAGVNYSTIVI